jgi:hypothetical protein
MEGLGTAALAHSDRGLPGQIHLGFLLPCKLCLPQHWHLERERETILATVVFNINTSTWKERPMLATGFNRMKSFSDMQLCRSHMSRSISTA